MISGTVLLSICNTGEELSGTSYGMFLPGKPPPTYLELPPNANYALGMQMKPSLCQKICFFFKLLA